MAATQAQGETLVRNARELRVKETDRIASVAAELRALGATIEERDDGFVVEGPTRLQGAQVRSHGDHRLAMLGAITRASASSSKISWKHTISAFSVISWSASQSCFQAYSSGV